MPSSTPGLLHHEPGSAYFSTADGKAVFLRGDHTWTNNISFSNAGQFNFGAYLNLLHDQGSNLIRYWMWAGARADGDSAGQALIQPFQRNADGKWDLTKFNQAYFDHVAANVDAAAAKGIYVDIMALFDYDPKNHYGWDSSVWNGKNNVNGTTTNNIAIEESDPAALPLQKAYIAKLLDTVGHKSNVMWEIANETHNSQASIDWSNTLVDFMHQYQSSHGLLAQPVGITATFPEGNQSRINPMLEATNADWISPNGWEHYQWNPPDGSTKQVSIVDSDHTFGIGGDANWVWQQFISGQGGVLVMDDMRGTGLGGVFDVGPSHQAGETSERFALKEISQALQHVDVTTMTPRDYLTSTGFAMADPSRGEYVILAPSGGSFSVDLSAASGKALEGRWISVGAGAMSDPFPVQGGKSSQWFQSPTGDAVLVLSPAASQPPPAVKPDLGSAGPNTGGAAPAPVTPSGGASTLVVRLSEDAWQGDAQAWISVDGERIGTMQTITALRSSGQTQNVVLKGDWGPGPHSVGVQFLNDAYGGTPSTDRNLHVEAVSMNGVTSGDAPQHLYSAGLRSFGVDTAGAKPGAGSLVLHLSEDAYQGDAMFQVAVDGKALGGPQTVTALHGNGGAQVFAFDADLAAGAHDVAVTFLNDLWHGTPSTDRNLHVEAIEYGGKAMPGTAATLYSAGTQHFGISVEA